jgi:hypothetical protein
MSEMATKTKTKPGRLTDDKWWFCEIGEHDKCVVEIELTSRFEGCPCECHQKVASEADTGGEWRALAGPAEFAAVVDQDGREVARCYRHADTKWAEDNANQIVTDHARAALVPGLVKALDDLLAYSAGLILCLEARGVALGEGPQMEAARTALAPVKGRE